MVKIVNKISKYPLSQTEALEAFAALNNTPELVTKIEQGTYQFEDEAFADWARHKD